MTSAELSFDVSPFRYDPETGQVFRGFKRVGSPTVQGYRRVCCNGVRVMEHRLAWRLATGSWPLHEIDHVNRDRSDNRLSNLREATAGQNQVNKPAASFIGTRGAFFDTTLGRWRVALGSDGSRSGGYASHSISAVVAARLISRTLHQEFAQ